MGWGVRGNSGTNHELQEEHAALVALAPDEEGLVGARRDLQAPEERVLARLADLRLELVARPPASPVVTPSSVSCSVRPLTSG